MNYWLYFWCRITSVLGGAFQVSIIPIVILKYTNSGKMLGSILGIQEILLFIISFIAGYIADKFNRKYIMIICDLLNSLLLLMYLYFSKGNINFLLTLILIQNSLNKIFSAASRTILSQLVNEEDLLKKKSFVNVVIKSINVLSPPIAIFLYTQLGLNFILIFNFVTFLISGILEMFIKYQPHYIIKRRSNILNDYSVSILYLKNSNYIFKYLIFLSICLGFFTYPLTAVLFPYMISNYMKLPLIFLGYSTSSVAIGYIIGGLSLSKYSKKFKLGGLFWKNSIYIYILTIFHIPLAIYVFRHNLFLCSLSIIVLFFILGISNFICNEVSIVYIETLIPHEIKGRVFSLISCLGSILTPISFFIIAKTIDKINPIYLSTTFIILLSFFTFFIMKNLKINQNKMN